MRRVPLAGWVFLISCLAFASTWLLSSPRRGPASDEPAPQAPPAIRAGRRVSPLSQLAGAVAMEPDISLDEELPIGLSGVPRGIESSDAIYGGGRPYLVTITFDDGPHPTHTERLLEILERHRIPATFFVNGYWFSHEDPRSLAARAVLKKAHERGHLIANHTFRHRPLTLLTPDEQTEEIEINQQLIESVVEERPRFFRSPYGAMTLHGRDQLRRLGLTEIRWNATARDQEIRDARFISERVMFWIRRHRGGIVMLHDRYGWSVRAAAFLFAALERENCLRLLRGEPTYQVVSLPDLLRSRRGPLVDLARADALHQEHLRAVCKATAAVPGSATSAASALLSVGGPHLVGN